MSLQRPALCREAHVPAPAALLGCPSAEWLLLLQMKRRYQAPVEVVTEARASQKSCVSGVQSRERGKPALSHSLGRGQGGLPPPGDCCRAHSPSLQIPLHSRINGSSYTSILAEFGMRGRSSPQVIAWEPWLEALFL